MLGRSDGELVLRAARQTIERARELCPLYASDAAPLHEGQLTDLLRQAGAGVGWFRFRSGRAAMAMLMGGVPQIAINAGAPRPLQHFALRHELHHVLHGDIGDADTGPIFLSDRGYWTLWERAADLFALADVVPAWKLGALEGAAGQRAAVRAAVAPIAPYWPEPDAWAQDRAGLRVRLFREYGI